MYMNHRTYRVENGNAVNPGRKTRNYLGIRKIDRYYDKNNSQLILMVSTAEMLDRELNTFLKEDRLILEAPLQPDYNRPYRTHLVGSDLLNDYENEVSVIGFSEIKLKPGYAYSLVSCQLINPALVKIILRSDAVFTKSHHRKNGN